MFVTNYEEILAQLDTIDPIRYAKTRNFLHGGVTRLSPYISRGILSTKQIARAVLSKGYKAYQLETFLKELAWRDYFQQVWVALGDKINTDIKQSQPEVSHYHIAKAIVDSNTGIQAIDKGIRDLYETGYMHNHLRMYVAATACNIGKAHWSAPARWMYYHLLDADWASNALSWQWVAGSFSHKKYYANQENINKYCGTHQQGTFLDLSYEQLYEVTLPEALEEKILPELKTSLPGSTALVLDEQLPVYVYNFYNLDPAWAREIKANRVLLLEPSFFEQYPVSDKTIRFVLDLSKNIEQLQVVIGEFDEVFDQNLYSQIHFKEHPANRHYKGTVYPRDWMFEELKGYYPSFSAYWKKAEKYLPRLQEEAHSAA